MSTIDIIRKIRMTSRSISVPFEAATGNTVRHLLVLDVLHKHGPMIQTRVSSLTGIDRSSMTTVANNMESEGLVRVNATEDKRAKLLSISPKGKDKLTNMYDALEDLFGDKFGLADKRVTALLNTLSEVEAHAESRREVA